MACQPLVDETLCSAHGDCEHLAPDVFSVEDVAQVVGVGERGRILAAARACPAAAITVIDTDTGEQVYP